MVMDYVRASAADGTMVPDELYSVYGLAETLGISRSPVREALLRLQDAGLVTIMKNRGFRIRSTQPDDVAEIFSLRLALEVPGARRAARWRSDDFAAGAAELTAAMGELARLDDEQAFFAADQRLHAMILREGRLERGCAIVDNLRANTRLLGASTAGDSRDYSDIIGEHEPIIDAIVAKDPAAAGAAMRAHLETTAVLLTGQALRNSGTSADPESLWEELSRGFAGPA